MDLSADANVRFALLFVCTWLIPSILASTGSSTVMILTSVLLSSDNAVYSVVDLPDPVGPVTNKIPCGLLIIWSNTLSSCSLRPRSFFSLVRAVLDVSRITIFSPYTVGRTDTRISYSIRSTICVIRPSCGLRFSAISIPPMILIRATNAGRILWLYVFCS